jgi:hypothetical protein
MQYLVRRISRCAHVISFHVFHLALFHLCLIAISTTFGGMPVSTTQRPMTQVDFLHFLQEHVLPSLPLPLFHSQPGVCVTFFLNSATESFFLIYNLAVASHSSAFIFVCSVSLEYHSARIWQQWHLKRIGIALWFPWSRSEKKCSWLNQVTLGNTWSCSRKGLTTTAWRLGKRLPLKIISCLVLSTNGG